MFSKKGQKEDPFQHLPTSGGKTKFCGLLGLGGITVKESQNGSPIFDQ